MSRITSKKAVELLAEEGLVTRIPGKGTFVIEHQEMPKALEIPADSMTEKKPLPDHPPVIGVVLDGFGADFGCQMLGMHRNGMPKSGIWDDARLLLWEKRRRNNRN